MDDASRCWNAKEKLVAVEWSLDPGNGPWKAEQQEEEEVHKIQKHTIGT